VGGNKPIHLDVRWIAATNRDLGKSVEMGEFRKDFFFRLNVIAVNLPPLCQRREDISLLADHFIQQFADDLKKPALELSDNVKEVFEVYNWPGNVREMKNLIERLTVLEPGPEVSIDGLPEHMLSVYTEEIGIPITTATGSRYKDAIEEFRRAFIVRAMRVAEGSQVRAAEILGLHRNTLIHHLRGFDIGPEEYGRESTSD
jgi:two-component system response regulator AtoC